MEKSLQQQKLDNLRKLTGMSEQQARASLEKEDIEIRKRLIQAKQTQSLQKNSKPEDISKFLRVEQNRHYWAVFQKDIMNLKIILYQNF
jgi:hypothetical protein